MKYSTYLSLFIVSCLLTSCFEYIEEITYTNEQSGACQITINCSQSRHKINTFIKLDTFMGFNIPSIDKISSEITNAERILKTCKGISDVYIRKDFNDYILDLKFKFDSTKNLNLAIETIAKSVARKDQIKTYDFFEFNNLIFKRVMLPNDSMIYEKSELRRLKIFSEASVTSIYKFNNSVKSVSNSKAIISKNQKAVFLKSKVSELIKNPNIFSNTITLK